MTSPRSQSGGPLSTPHEKVTFLMTDIENSTQLLRTLGDDYAALIARSRQLIHTAVTTHGGTGSPEEGDGFCAAFGQVAGAARAAVDIQRSFHLESWPLGVEVRVRIGIHTGETQVVNGHYFGPDLHRTSRITTAASGGQVLLSQSTWDQLREGDLPNDVFCRELGAQALKDFDDPEILFDLAIPGVRHSLASLSAKGRRPNNIPLAPDVFVGREPELKEVRTLLLRPEIRLLTLTGAGGTGKTRLALEVARGLLSSFLHGVFVVELSSVSDPALLPSTIVQTLRLPEFASKEPLETLKHYLAERELLLLLDNFEHIVEAVGDVLQLLGACSRLKVLVTSREILDVRMERHYVVPPLALPSEGDAQGVESLGSVESVRLLVDRIRHYDPAFELNSENAQDVCSICKRLDGLPLAIELAAGQLKLFTLKSLLGELANSFDVLSGGPRDLARHQRTLNSTIDWSYNLLDPDEQLLFRTFSVFRGGADIDSVVQVCSEWQPRYRVVDRLLHLVNKGLVRHETEGVEKRVSMLESIREFANQRLAESDEHARVHERHAHHFRALAESQAPGLVGRDQQTFITRLLREEDNLRASLGWAIEHGDAETTSVLLHSLLWMWIPRGRFTEGRAWADRALDAFRLYPPCRELGLMSECAGWLQALGGDYERAFGHFQRSYELFHALTDITDRVRSKITFGVACLVLGDPRGNMLTDEAIALCHSISDRQVIGLARLSEGIRHQFQGALQEASKAYEEALQAFTDCDHVYWRGQLLQNLAMLRLQDGNWREATDLAAEVFKLGQAYGYPLIRNLALAALGAVGVAKGTLDEAAMFFGAVDASLADLGVTFEPPEQAAMVENLRIIKESLGPKQFERAFDAGRLWSAREIDAAISALRDNLPA